MKKKNFGEKRCKVKNCKKKVKFLKGPTTKVKPQFVENYCEKLSKTTFFRIKKSFKLALKKLKIIGFKVRFKKIITNKAIQAKFTLVIYFTLALSKIIKTK